MPVSPTHPTPTVRDSGAPSRPDGSGLILVTGAGFITTFPLVGADLVIGRERDCDVSLAHEALSRRHAILRLGPPMTVQDLGSTNGTRVGNEVSRGGDPLPLSVGDAFHIGRLSFVVVRPPRAPSLASYEGVELLKVVDPSVAAASPLLRDIAKSGVNVLILGETGVGKEVLAETLHHLSARPGPLTRVNCASLAAALLESELFGHEKGAFTGATRHKVGLFEAGDRGTVLLDEVGELPLVLQAKLLRVLESREVRRVGAVKPIAVDVRVIAATNRNLPAEVTAGQFRDDLYYRLDGVTLTVPPLRERRSAIAPLALEFLRAAHHRRRGERAPDLSPGALTQLEAHAWPGNVRELKAVIERALLLARGGDLDTRHVVAALGKPASPRTEPRAASAPAVLDDDEARERQRIVEALEACAGNQTRAARRLGIARATLTHKLALYRLPRPRK
jgi:transcriptional regulator with PAS, ATPase and Fis domain